MKSRRITHLATALFMTLLSIGSAGAIAKPHHADEGAMPGMMLHRMLKGLDLTDAQQQQIRDLTDKFRASQPEREQMQQQQEQLQTLVKADTFDTNAARALLEKQQTQMLDRKIAGLQLLHDIRAVLTVEQKATLDAKMAKLKERAKDRQEDEREPR
ncbi:MAG TPA: P pilus assembly/Cpx signaling pathway inhibitor/zinc-resistance associated protein [Rheinheimera sp.]|nr:P pilus assembly/Cpx signaling pathway inhibitor/zinc-resistance associated protein [Rheinheimera sp.]